MYRNLGYYQESPAQILLPAARLLYARFTSNIDTVLSDAIREAGFSDRRFMKDMTRDDPIQLSKAAAFPPNSPQLRALLHIWYHVCAAAGWGDYRPTVLRYTRDPRMSLDDILIEALNEHVDRGLKETGQMWPEKCNVEVFRTHLGTIIKRLALLYEYRPYIVDKLERYTGDLLYKMKLQEISPTALDQFDRTLLYYLVFDAKNPDTEFMRTYDDGTGALATLTFPDAKDANPLIGPEIARIKSVVQPGPFMRYARLLSNMDQRELAYTYTPVLPDLPLVTGYLIPVGPFYEMDLSVHTRVTWGDAEQFAGYMETLVFPTQPESSMSQLGFRNPAPHYGAVQNFGALQPVWDWPTLEIHNDTDNQNQHSLRYSWYSPTMQRMMHDRNGATVDHLVLDLAATHSELGETPCPMQNIQDVRFADLSLLPGDRRIVNTASADIAGGNVDDDPVLRKRIYEDIWHFEGGKVLKKKTNVDMTALYNRIGNVSFRPALSEYFMPSRAWFLQPDQTALDYIVGKLSLNVYDAKRSILAITISHNAEVYKRLTGQQPPFDVEAVIKAMHAI